MDAATAVDRRGPPAGHPGQLRDHPAGRHHPQPLGADARGGLGPDRRARTSTWSSARSGCSPAGSSPTCAATRSSSAASTRRRPGAASSSTRRCSTSTSAPTCPAPTASGTSARAEAAELAKLAETTYRDVNIGLANQFARFADTVGVDITKVIEACNTQPYSHIHQPGIAVGGHCIPVYPRMYLWNDPTATVVRAAREANAAMPAYAVDLLAAAYGDLTGARVLVLGAAYRGGVKETAFSGVFPTVEALRGAGRGAVTSPTRCTPPTSWPRSASRRTGASRSRAAVVQADHAEYRDAGPGRPAGRTRARRRPPGDRPGRLGRRPPRRHRRLRPDFASDRSGVGALVVELSRSRGNATRRVRARPGVRRPGRPSRSGGRAHRPPGRSPARPGSRPHRRRPWPSGRSAPAPRRPIGHRATRPRRPAPRPRSQSLAPLQPALGINRTRVVVVGQHHRRADEDAVAELGGLVDQRVVLQLDVVADPDARADVGATADDAARRRAARPRGSAPAPRRRCRRRARPSRRPGRWAGP